MRSKKRASDDRTLTDVTYGNKLLVPLPATLTQEQFAMRTLLAHPWRSLGRGWEAAMPTVWTLAKPRFSYELSRLFEGGILARGALRTAGSRPHTEEEAALAGHSERGPPESRGEPSP
jgi:hypothetical protein